MIPRFFKKIRRSLGLRKSTVRELLAYLLGAIDSKGEVRLVTPELIAGDPRLVCALVQAMRGSNRFATGVLSFNESWLELGPKVPAIISKFEELVTAGLGSHRLAFIWIAHQHPTGLRPDNSVVPRLELHFAIVNLDLESGKAFRAYLHKIDLRRFQLWTAIINRTHELTDPSARPRRLVRPQQRLPNAVRAAQEEVVAHLTAAYAAGTLSNAADVRTKLKANGWEIVRENSDGVTLRTPATPGRKFRLRGYLFEPTFGSGREPPHSIRHHTLPQLWTEFHALQKRRITYNRKRYGPDRSVPAAIHSHLDQLYHEPAKHTTHTDPQPVRAEYAQLQQQLKHALVIVGGAGRTVDHLSERVGAIRPVCADAAEQLGGSIGGAAAGFNRAVAEFVGLRHRLHRDRQPSQLARGVEHAVRSTDPEPDFRLGTAAISPIPSGPSDGPRKRGTSASEADAAIAAAGNGTDRLRRELEAQLLKASQQLQALAADAKNIGILDEIMSIFFARNTVQRRAKRKRRWGNWNEDGELLVHPMALLVLASAKSPLTDDAVDQFRRFQKLLPMIQPASAKTEPPGSKANATTGGLKWE